MTTSLHLRLREDDARAFDAAAVAIAGLSGAPYLGRMAVIRAALAAFNERHSQQEPQP